MLASGDGAQARKPIRNAEKRRQSTCAFADRVAVTSINCYRVHEESALLQGQQTVLAAFLLHFENTDELQARTHLSFPSFDSAQSASKSRHVNPNSSFFGVRSLGRCQQCTSY